MIAGTICIPHLCLRAAHHLPPARHRINLENITKLHTIVYYVIIQTSNMNGFSKDWSILKGMVMMIDCYSNEGIHRINMSLSRGIWSQKGSVASICAALINAFTIIFTEGWNVLESQYLCVRQIVVRKARIILELQSTFTGGSSTTTKEIGITALQDTIKTDTFIFL